MWSCKGITSKWLKSVHALCTQAVWSRFFPLYERLIPELASGIIGDSKLLRIEFSVPISEVPRIRDKALGGGALLDIGVYPLNIAVFLFGRPDKILAEGTMMDSGTRGVETNLSLFCQKDFFLKAVPWWVSCLRGAWTQTPLPNSMADSSGSCRRPLLRDKACKDSDDGHGFYRCSLWSNH